MFSVKDFENETINNLFLQFCLNVYFPEQLLR